MGVAVRATQGVSSDKTLNWESRLLGVNQIRRCSRPGCSNVAVATLTYAYARQTAFIGPLIPSGNPHSWDLCEKHASKITAPVGWELLRVADLGDDEDDLTALAEAVREAGGTTSGLLDSEPGGAVAPHHPVHRAKRQELRRGHLSIVPDADDETSS